MIRCILAAVVVSFGLSSVPAHAACKNLVGGVCLDKKPAKVKKKAIVKKKVKKRKTKVKAKPVVAKPQVASSCISTTFKNVGDPRENASDSEQVVVIRIQNKCGQAIDAYVALNSCVNPSAYYIGARGNPKRAFKVGAKKRKTITVVEPRPKPKNASTARINYAFKGQKGSFPAGRC